MATPETTGIDTTGMPHPANRIPFVGDVLGVSGDTPIQDNMKLAKELGPIFAKRFFDNEVVLVSGADLVAELSDETRFAKHVAPALARIRGIAGDGLFTAYNHEPNWQKAHDILLPAFSMQSMRGYHPTMLEVANRLVAHWDAHVDGPLVEVAEDMTRLTLDTIGLSGFGFDFTSFERAEPHPFVQALVRSLAHAQAKSRELPWIGPILNRGADERFAGDAEFMAGIVDEVIKARKDSGDTATEDLLGLMLNAPHPVSGEVLDDVNIRNQVITFLIAGHETTSGALSFALHYLVKNPAVLARAQAEVDAMWGDQADPQPTFEEVGKLRYVRQVLNEALRLWPTAAAYSREATQDTVLGGRYPVKKGQWVVVLAPALHRDPVWGDNVEAFDPERFTPEREKARPVHAFKPFGTGERACIGRQFALHEATLLLGMLIHRYRLLDTEDYQLKVKETLTLKPAGFRLGLARRTSADRRQPQVTTTQEHSTGGTNGRARQGTALTVLHGSNLGTCRAFARQLADEGEDRGFTAMAAPLDEYVGKLPTDGPVVIVAASYNGKPTDDAAQFVGWLAESTEDDLSAVSYAVLGVGDRNWAATYQHVPTLIDNRLAELGGTRLVDRCEADASGDLSGDVETWSDALWRGLLERYGDPDAEPAAEPTSDRLYDIQVLKGGVTSALDARYEVAPMTVLANEELVDVDSPIGRSKRYLRIALPEGVTYRTGDHLTVVPDNPPELVRRAADRFGVDLDLVLSINPRQKTRRALPIDRPLTVRQLLTHFVELQNPATQAQVAVLAEANPCPPERKALQALAQDAEEFARYVTDCGRSVLDLLEENPACQLPGEVFLEMLSPIQARHYSISSSAKASPGEVELIVGVLSGPARSGSGTFHGVSSYYLSTLAAGERIRARVDPAREAFRAPEDPATPVIMISAGTGLAPFRGFIGDRAQQAADGVELGQALCFFGVRHPEVDYLHRAELEAAEKAGVVSMRPAFSRAPVDECKYVQDRIAADGADVWAVMQAGGRVYICGDGKGMAPAVREAFKRVQRENTGGDEAAARAWLDGLISEDRYVEDVWAG
ncbi:bifunctional cytochrome P450/NADPH--P450 reductase [Kutzneria albida]|uniref:Bifunctional cytochrome P450/NADPH--P450 reductase n=1 Tax=Kutzneria albida DSM 43870 TaxID=1449976 RepID=W5VZN0_9PSEU|nr:cytochrome P450 [Kutzneria albida]AHH94032.1 putative bifunctional P-450/NADPH-P450 reductase2 [Kutzneria albida DSM 43870]